ncbi:LacI family transcriptional regulator [Ruminococcaceae bacterium OttesenSCG-928-A16]|nr:LacI family transcriptional regulator [Ruminococcaceae bacterium OttesenSCG-928-A16]
MNIYDIAREAGVSISTVSRVINNKTNVTPATRAKIQAVLDKHQYAPSAIARGLVAHSMKTVAIMAVDLRVPHYAYTTYVIEQEFTKRNYNVMVCNTGGTLEETRRYAAELAQRQIDGVVLVGSVFNTLGQDPEVARALQGMPVVLANGTLPWPQAYSVPVDDSLGVQLAVRHLAQKGHQHIVYVKDRDTAAAQHKQNGFVAEMQAHGLACGEDVIFATPYGLDGGKHAAAQILAQKKRPTAVVCAEDLTAVGVLKALTKAGINVPGDIAVTGYNNSEYSEICTPELTSVNNKGEEAAVVCAQLLEARIEGKEFTPPQTILPELVVRESS